MTDFTPKDVGTWITGDDGMTFWRISEVEAEPRMTIVDVATENPMTRPVSFFRGYRRMLVEPRKPGRPKKEKQYPGQSTTDDAKGKAARPGELVIVQATETTPAKISFSGQAGEGATLTTAARNLMLNLNLNLDPDKIDTWPFTEYDRGMMISMLNPKKVDRV